MAEEAAAPETSVAGAAPARLSGRLLPVVMALFFAFGFCTVLVDTLTPKLKELFALSYREVAFTPFAFFGAYFVVSVPAAWLLTRIGYLQTVTVGLVIAAVGALLFTPAAAAGRYAVFLLAVFVMASGVTVVQVAANPLAAEIGDPRYASSRLTLAQAFNSLATTVGPIFGSALILARSRPLPEAHSVTPAALAVLRRQEAHAVQGPFVAIAVALLLLAVGCAFFYRLSPRLQAERRGGYGRLLKHRRLMLGVGCVFLYVGAEVTIGSFLTIYLLQPSVAEGPLARWTAVHGGLPIQAAGALVSVYWGLAMVGRFAGSAVLRRVRAGTVLTCAALGATALAMSSILLTGVPAGAALLGVGLFNSIMFPTIFTLAIADLGEDAAKGSGLLCLAIVGGAVIPLAVGQLADRVGLAHAFAVPVLCYLGVAAYGLAMRRDRVDARAAVQSEGPMLG